VVSPKGFLSVPRRRRGFDEPPTFAGTPRNRFTTAAPMAPSDLVPHFRGMGTF